MTKPSSEESFRLILTYFRKSYFPSSVLMVEPIDSSANLEVLLLLATS
ncbi:MAG: hypothetical protein KAR64_00850 [Thermoplasmatales archaeon]|nr:hypothetical protein [Thermoplasmatales archaeon]